jgi:hypothetical protein
MMTYLSAIRGETVIHAEIMMPVREEVTPESVIKPDILSFRVYEPPPT